MWSLQIYKTRRFYDIRISKMEQNKMHLINRLVNECYVYSSGDLNLADEVEKIKWVLENGYLTLDLDKIEALREEKDNLDSSIEQLEV